jgi:hypothetical protein
MFDNSYTELTNSSFRAIQDGDDGGLSDVMTF